ncbi:hypothetical protein [Ktedonospora formicarum]|uniref:IrrE N-terminal-like domain-containing protein n=1 Tax=Ktedonospora formicarum TaxID=2778364 RepID=A0A8J3IDU8_9CHLR|nr:hypothetical protein [Ktedonospora formicarum]GHO50493.1 hypothetical protein KSX_86560 [Ktedonospora formicarum]
MLETLLSQKPETEELLSQFPCDIATLAAYGLDIPILARPNLSVRCAHAFLCALEGKALQDDWLGPDRPLYGLLHLGPPSNVILFNEALSPSLTNYVIAHEIGHFFADVLVVQHRWLGHALSQRVSPLAQEMGGRADL